MKFQEPVWAIVRTAPGGTIQYLTEAGVWTKNRAMAMTSGRKELMEGAKENTRIRGRGMRVVDLTRRGDFD